MTSLALLAIALPLSLSDAPTHAIARAPSRHVVFEGMRVHYKLLGDKGPALVLVHGWSCNMGFWRGQAPLAQSARLVLVDLPGHGASDAPEISYTIPLFARAVEAVLRDAGIERAILAGHSMGTPVVWQFSRLFPERTRALIAADGSFRSYITSQEDREKFAARYRGPNFRAAMTAVVDGIAGKTPPPALLAEIRSEMLKTPQHVVASAAYEMSDPKLFVSEPRIAVPVLAVYANSPFWSAEYKKSIEAFIPELEYRSIDGVGHFLMLEKPEAFNQALLRFLRERRLLEP